MPRRTEHTARKAIEQLAAGKIPELIEDEELSSLEAYILTLPNPTLLWLITLAVDRLRVRDIVSRIVSRKDRN